MPDTNEYTPDLYTLIDEENKEHVFELLDVIEENDQRYFALVPYSPDAEELLDSDGELVILKAEMSGDEETLVSIDDDDEFERIGGIFLSRIEEIFSDECDCECDDENCDCCHE